MKFKKALFSTLFLFSLVVGYIGYYNMHILPKDVKKYKEFVEKNKEDQNKKQPDTKQLRTQIQKDIWQQDDRGRLHYRINAEKSTLYLKPQKNKIEMHEEMEKISCLLQEKIYYQSGNPMQELRAIIADHGTYDFSKHEFLAETVFLDFYTSKGHDLPHFSEMTSPFLKGLAKQVSFTFSADGPSFHAEKFQAQMQSIGNIK
nr:hypothetical protein [Chlamydiia bacterium]